MNSVSAQNKNPGRRGAKKQTLSTSQARANFADALGMAQDESTIIGFDRYGKLVAAVVPIDAVRMLAGLDAEVAPAVRAKIGRMARTVLHVAAPASVPSGRGAGEERPALEPRSKERKAKEQRPALERRSKEKKRRRKDKREKKKKKAKAARGKRPRRISRKI